MNPPNFRNRFQNRPDGAARSADDGRMIYSPSTLAREVRFHLEQGYGQVWLRGEVSNLTRPRSGHMYFSIKDARSQLRCAWFRSRNQFSQVKLADGAMILARGKLSLYEPRGDFQFIVDHVEDEGEGALRRQFEDLKRRLAAEGVFAQAVERPLPRFPRQIAVITAPQGAALQDVRSVLARRYPLARLMLLASRVQGEGAALELRNALRDAVQAGPDVILLTRGGGSLEDLWPFNDEKLARAIAASPIPVVSAVGHEIDFSIADFAADYRAATPSAGAELITPDQGELENQIERFRRALTRCQETLLERIGQTVDHLDLRLMARSPAQLEKQAQLALIGLRARAQRVTGANLDAGSARLDQVMIRLRSRHPRRLLDDVARRLHAAQAAMEAAMRRRLVTAKQDLVGAARNQSAHQLARQIGHHSERVDHFRSRLAAACQASIDRSSADLARNNATLTQLSPTRILERGYSITFDKATGAAIKAPAEAPAGTRLETRLAQGSVESVVCDADT